MSAYHVIEEDHGTYTRTAHPHNGYYAGDFGGLTAPVLGLSLPPATSPALELTL